MEGLFLVFTALIVIAVFIVVMRLLGAWMLRINEIIKNQKTLIDEIRRLNR